MTDQPATSFKAVRADLPAASGVASHGEVDVAAVPALERALEAAIETSAGGFVVDLSGVEFMDSSGLLAVLNARGLLRGGLSACAAAAPCARRGTSRTRTSHPGAKDVADIVTVSWTTSKTG